MFEDIKVELQDTMGSDRHIAESAWTSSLDHQKKQSRTETDVSRVVNMLADFKHSTPFESVVLRFWIKMPISTDRQFMTHRLQSASGMSGRYRTMPSEFQSVPEDVSEIMHKIESMQGFAVFKNVYAKEYFDLCKRTNDFYRQIVMLSKQAVYDKKITDVEMKRAREFFRNVLPQGNMTERISVMNLRAWANFQKLRNSPHAQPEIRYVAELMLKEVENKKVCPVALEALKRNKWEI